MIARVVLAVLVAAAGALLGGAASKAVLHIFWPGVIAAFVVGFPLFLFLSRRLS